MKKLYILGLVALAASSLTSCDDFLDENRYPLSEQTANAEFWSSAPNVQGQINYFYENFLGYGNGSSYGEFYFKTLSDDQANDISNNGSYAAWKNINVPTSSSNWNGPYTEIRRANNIIEGVESGKLSGSVAENFIGIARLMRAYQYYWLVRAYGDVPLVKGVLDPKDDAALFGPRTARNEVMDYVLDDLDYAITHIALQSSKNEFSKDLAAAIKAEICLFEGAFAKYHQNDNTRANKYFTEVVNATTPLLAAYPIGNDYKATYNSFRRELSGNSEVIFMKEYERDVFMHCTIDYTSTSTPISGITKDAFDAYLFKDGKPLALTTMDKNDAGVMIDGTYSIRAALENRDARLSATIDTAVYYVEAEYQLPNTMPMTSFTGYGVNKFRNPALAYADATTIKNYTCAPLFWGAQIALAYAEAKAELGTLTDADMNVTLNKLYSRAGLPAQTVASLTSMNDPANNMGVSSLIWEVRRCRRCELILDKDTRYWDLIRWHQLELLDTQNHPNIALGANISAAAVQPANVGGYMKVINGDTPRTFDAKHYFYPVPKGQIALNPALTQNKGW